MITHYRVDMRVVHGQTVTILKKTFPLNGIIVIDDEIAADKYMSSLYASTVPSDIKVHIRSVDKAIPALQKAEESKLNYFIIFKSPLAVKQVIQQGYSFKGKLTVGQQFIRDDAPKYLKSVGSTKEEFDALQFAHDHGTDIIFDPSCIFENIPFEEAKKLYLEANK